MPNTINNDTIFEINNTADVDEPAMNSVIDHCMPPPASLPVNNRGDYQGSMPSPAHLPMSLGSVGGDLSFPQQNLKTLVQWHVDLHTRLRPEIVLSLNRYQLQGPEVVLSLERYQLQGAHNRGG